LRKLSVFWTKKRHFFANFVRQNISKIITSFKQTFFYIKSSLHIPWRDLISRRTVKVMHRCWQKKFGQKFWPKISANSASITEAPGFESRKGEKILGLHILIAVLCQRLKCCVIVCVWEK
jgi:hypothetical protein